MNSQLSRPTITFHFLRYFTMKRWISRWLIGVSVIHSILCLVVFSKVFQSIFLNGLFDAVGHDPSIGVAVWCVLFGAVLFICGLAISSLEKELSNSMLPKSLGWSLFALSVVGVVLMPASGFWLAFPPAIAILVRKPSVLPAMET